MHTLENEFLQINVHPKGAELQRLYNKQTRIEHLWSGDAAYWGKFSPVLFPIIGSLKENTFNYKEKAYNLPRHGFARDKEFTLKEKTENSISFTIQQNEETLKVFPFYFLLTITYALQQNSVTCTYTVENTGTDNLFFSIGAHPAFAVPFLPNTNYEDYFLEFNNDDILTRWKLTSDGLISNSSATIELQNNQLQLTHNLFKDDAIVLKDLKSTSIKLASLKSNHGFDFSFNNAPFFGIWAATNAPFVCLEPWNGIADNELHNQQLQKKEGINCLTPSEIFRSSWGVTCF